MDDLLEELFNTSVPYDIDDNKVSEFRNHFKKLFEDYFSEVKNHIKNLLVNKPSIEIIKFISKEKNKVYEYKKRIFRKEYALKKIPLTVKAYQIQFDTDEETAIRLVYHDKFQEIQYGLLNESYLKLMSLHREYSDDLLFELRRFDFDLYGYNDIPFDDVFKEPSNWLQWFNRLFDEYFDKLTYDINAANDWNKIDTLINAKIALFNQIKNELSEKGNEYFIKWEEKFEKDKNTEKSKTDSYSDAVFMFVEIEMIYKRQHKYIDEALNKLKKLHEDYLPKLLSTTTQQQITEQNQIKVQSNEIPYFTRSFTSDEKKKLYDGLLKHNFLPQDTDYNHFCYVFGGNEMLNNDRFIPLKWQGTLKELNYLINSFFNYEPMKWEKAIQCFLHNNNSINKKSLSTAIDKYDKDPDRKPYIDGLLK